MSVLGGRRDHDIGLKGLVVKSCRVHRVEYMSELKELVKRMWWGDLVVEGSDYGGADDSPNLADNYN